MNLLDRFLGHDQWATTQILKLCNSVTDRQLDQDFDIGHRNIRATLTHMITALEFWNGYLNGQPSADDLPDHSIPELMALHEQTYATFSSLAHRIQDTHHLDDSFNDWQGNPQTLGGTIAHLFLHHGQHRSEVQHMLHRLGVASVQDFDVQNWESVM